MTELKLQSDIVRKFSELYPEKRGQLFHVPNERNNKTQAFVAQSIGIVPGVSDLVFFGTHILGMNLLGIEVKLPGSSHKVSHIKSQINWAKKVELNLGRWRIVRTVEEAINFIEGKENDGLKIKDVEQMLMENKNKKTVKF